MRQKIIGLFLLVVWLSQHFIAFIYFQFERNNCQQVNFELAQQKSINKKIYYFAYNDQASINWEKYGKEINRECVLYDVVESFDMDGKVIIKCFKDKKESKILKHFNLINNQNNGNKKSQTPIKKLISFKFFPIENKPLICFQILQINPFKYTQQAKTASAFCGIFKPPPQL